MNTRKPKHRYVIKIDGNTWQYYQGWSEAYRAYQDLLKLYNDSLVMLYSLQGD